MSSSKKDKIPFLDPRIKLSDIEHLFTFTKDGDTLKFAKCLFKNCENVISANREGQIKKYNLLRHLKRQHLKEYEYLVNVKESKPITNSNKEKKQTKVENFFKCSTLTINMDSKTFQKGIVEMVCFNSAPLTLFCGKGFTTIAGDMAKKLGVSLSYETVRDLVLKYAEEERTKLREKLKNNLVFLQMDGVTRGCRNFLAVNVQYYNKETNKMEIKNLNIVDTQHQHTSEQIKIQVKNILQQFDIVESQVLSICVDNANNMVRAVRTFSDTTDEEDNQEEFEEFFSNEECNQVEEWACDPKLILPQWLLECNADVQLMRCAVHTLQLSIWAGLQSKEADIHLNKIRTAVIKLRTPQVRIVLQKRFGLTQSLDVVTRWGSTYLMIKRFLKFRSFCEEAGAAGTKELAFTEDEWESVIQLSELLAKPYAATIRLQSNDLTPGVFFKEWSRLKSYLSQQPGKIASEILKSMIKREDKILLNTHLLAGIYVDPRYRLLLSKEQHALAKNGLFDIAVRLQKISLNKTLQNNDNKKNDENIASILSLSSSDECNETVSVDESDDEFEKFLDIQEKRKRVLKIQMNDMDLLKKKFDNQCESIEAIGRIKVRTVFEAIEKYPKEIWHACAIASCMPITEVSVERLFSSVKIILSDLRQSIKEDLLSAIIFYKNNNYYK